MMELTWTCGRLEALPRSYLMDRRSLPCRTSAVDDTATAITPLYLSPHSITNPLGAMTLVLGRWMRIPSLLLLEAWRYMARVGMAMPVRSSSFQRLSGRRMSRRCAPARTAQASTVASGKVGSGQCRERMVNAVVMTVGLSTTTQPAIPSREFSRLTWIPCMHQGRGLWLVLSFTSMWALHVQSALMLR